MAKRRKLLETAKSAGESVAGTIGSVAGTVAEGGRDVAGEARERGRSLAGTLSQGGRAAAGNVSQRVQSRFEELTDDTVTDQEQARLQRARIEARREARRDARKEFREEYRENLYDEAYDAELQQLQRQNQATRRQLAVAQEREAKPQPPMGMALFGVPTGERRERETDDRTDRAPQQAMGNVGAIFGMPSGAQDVDDGNRRDPLFGLQF